MFRDTRDLHRNAASDEAHGNYRFLIVASGIFAQLGERIVKASDLKRMCHLEEENRQLKRTLADLFGRISLIVGAKKE